MWKNLTGSLLPMVLVLAGSSAQAQTAPKIGVFDSNLVLSQAAEGKRLQKVLNVKRDLLRQNVQLKENEVKELQQKLREGEFTLSDEKKSGMQKDLQRKLVDLDSAKQAANNNLKIELEDVRSQLEKKLVEVIEELGEEQNFSLILEKNTQVVFSSPAIDISQVVIDRLDQKYPPTDTDGTR
ncbi:MAG: OmpH family outer membrane protein [Acidobacteriota bacterium]